MTYAGDGGGSLKTKEIKSDDWAAFFQLFSRMERDTLVNIEHADKTGAIQSIATQVPLQMIEFNQTGACNDVLRITGAGGVTHEILEPIHVKVRQDSSNRKILQIDAENGATTIGFHSGRLEEVLRSLEQGAAPK